MNDATPEANLRRVRFVVFLAPIVLLAPFAGKPYQADDHVFIWVAEQIAQDPLDFFGFEVDYGVEQVPIYVVNNNPPGVSYYLALIGVLTGWSLVAMHLGMSLFAACAALGTFELARDLGARAFIAATAAVLTPAFLVSGSDLMTDVPLLAFYVWAVVAWRRGCERASWRWLFVAIACATIAPLVKLFGVTLVPLLLFDGFVRRPRVRAWWLWLLMPVGAFVAFQTHTQLRYGINPIFDAAGTASASHWRQNERALTRPLLTLMFLGGSMLPMAIAAGARSGTRWVVGSALGVVVFCVPLIDGYSFSQLMIGASEAYRAPVLVHLAVFGIAGLLILVAAVRGLRDFSWRDRGLLGAWVAGTFVFTVFLNHYINVRAILPALPALAVLIAARPLSRLVVYATAGVGVVFGAWVLVGDFDVAEHDRHAAQVALDRAEADDVPLHYVAFWGFEYHLMNGGARPLAFEEQKSFSDPARPLMEPGSLLVVDAYARAAWTPLPRGFTLVQEIREPYTLASTTFDTGALAGFYWHGIGVLPYRFGYVEPETYLLVRWEGVGQE